MTPDLQYSPRVLPPTLLGTIGIGEVPRGQAAPIRAIARLTGLDPRLTLGMGFFLMVEGIDLVNWNSTEAIKSTIEASVYPVYTLGENTLRGDPVPGLDALQLVPTQRADGSYLSVFGVSSVPPVDAFELVAHFTSPDDAAPFTRCRVYAFAVVGLNPQANAVGTIGILDRVRLDCSEEFIANIEAPAPV